MEILINVVPYLIIIMLFVPLSSVVYGFAQKFLEEDKLLEEGKKEKVKMKPQYNVFTVIVEVIVECALFYSCGISLDFIVYSFLNQILLISAITDLKSCIIPNETNFLGFIVGIFYAFCMTMVNFKKGCLLLAGGLAGFLIFFAIYLFSLLVFRKEGMGGGDIKLMGVIGLFMGLSNIIQVFVLSFFIGSIISIILLIARRKNGEDYIPFGPFIVLASYITMLLPAWYTYNQIYRFLIYNF